MAPSLRLLHRTIRQQVSWLLLALLGLSGTMQAQTTIRYVKPAASGNGSGSSWTNASGNLQAMIDASSSGQQVWVARGTYQPATNGSFALKDEVAIYGGFAGTEGSLTDRPVVNPNAGPPSGSVLRGNGNRVITNPAGLDRMARLDGFVITGGYALKGGGMYNSVSSPTIANCSFLNNTASKGYTFPDGKLVQGGGMYNENSSSPALINCLFKDNSSIDGGGMYNFMASSPRLTNCSFISNSVFTNGGALADYNSSPTLINCSFQSNEATNGSGGGIYNTLMSRPDLTNCSFQGNVTGAAGTGGSMYNENNSGATLANSVVFGNGGANTFSSDGTGSVTASYTLFELSVTGYTNGGNNRTTATSPFASSTDTRLNGCTTALNAGSDLAYLQVNGTATDLAAQPRKYNNGPGTPDRIDMGAYEYQAAPSQIRVTNPAVSTATVGAVFSQSFTASGGASLYSYSVVSSSLPASLTLSRAGVLSGTPTEAGSYSVLVKTQDTYGCTATATTAYSLTVSVLPIRYVKPGGSGTGSGNSWADASSDLQSQIDLAGAQQVWVAGGTYRPNTNGSFSMKNGVGIYGGFAGTESSLSQRPIINPTTGRPSSSTLAGNGSNLINNYSGLTRTAVLNGFVITGGKSDNDGGAIYNFNGSNPTIANCSFLNNSARNNGGGVYNNNSNPTISNCVFQGNSASQGGGLYNASSSPTVTNCSFQGNSAGFGGGTCNRSGNAILTNCSFQGNSASVYGGGVYNFASNPVLTNCSFQGNSGNNGGGMYNDSNSDPVLTNCVVFGNGGNNTFTGAGASSVSASYSLFETLVTGYTDGGHNLTTTRSPFVSTTSTQLNGCAPAINTGSNGAYKTAGGLPTDLASQPRQYNDGTIDMGAYEYQANPTTISVSNPAVSTATVGIAFNQSFTASGGSDPYSYSVISSNQPASLSLSTEGVLSGTPTQAGSYSVLVQARDASGCVGIPVKTYVLTVSPASPIRYVKQGGMGSGNSWTDASGDLQSQINLSGAQQVWVAGGTYQPTAGGSFAMKNGVAIYGGFAGTESSLGARPPVDPTIGQLSASVLKGNGSSIIRNPASLSLNTTARLDGFIISGGGNVGAGGGMRNSSSSPAITNCSFQNHAVIYGGGMLNEVGSSPTLTNCSFLNNSASNGDGGGMLNQSRSNPTLVNCLFQGNSAGRGGGINNQASSSPNLINCSLQNNMATGLSRGGGMYNENASNPILTNCSLQGNSAVFGGGMYNETGSSLALTNCVVFGNGGTNTFRSSYGGSVSVSYSLLETTVTGYSDRGHNLTTTLSPFASTTSTQLNGCAPAINAGSNDAYSNASGPATDLAGNARIYPGGGQIDMGACEYQADPTLISVTNPSVTTATVGQPFSQVFTAGGGAAPYSYSVVSSNLPASLSLSTAGVLSGTPVQSGSYSLNVQAQDASGCVGVPSKAYALTVSDPVVLVPTLVGFAASPTAACAGSPVTFTATVGQVTGAYNYTLTNGIGTPTTNSLTGTASTTAFSQNLTAAGSGSQNFTLTVSSNGQSATATTALLVNGLPTAGLVSSGPLTCTQTSVTLTASGAADDPGSFYTFTGADGLVLPGSGNMRVVSSAGSYSVMVANVSGCTSNTSTSVISTTASVLVTNPPVNMATAGVAFSQPFTAGGGISPYAYSVISSNLPASLSLSTTGVLSGTPTVTGSYSVLVVASDANGCMGVGLVYSLTVSEPVSSIRYVKQGGSGTGSGNSWADASADLQSQIDLGGAQQVWVATGTYQPSAGSSFAMKNGVAIYGGFVGTESSLDQRPAINPLTARPFSSTLVGNGQSVIKNFYATARLDGFLITGGNADYGGGMFNEGGSPTIANCIFQGNSAGSGGGMFNLLSSPRLINCSFLNNSANSGGGMANNSSSYPVLINCSFQGNSAGSGGGMNNYFGSGASLTNCVVFGNGGANTFTGSYGGSVSASYSLFDASVTGYADGGHNLTTTTSPFVSTTSTQLNGCAPALNTGNNDAYTNANGPATDLAGNARIYPGGGQIDMGAYEYQAGHTLISVTNPSVSTATVGQPFSQSFTASGGTVPYSFSVVSSNLPASLSLSPAGVLSGTPTQTGSYSLNVQAQDASGCVGVPVKAYALTVSDATPTLIGFSASPGTVCAGSPVTFTATVGNITGSYTYTLTNGIGTPTGSTITGTASTTAFSQNLTTAGSGNQNVTLTISSNGQLATATTSVLVNALPTASLVSSGPLTCTQTSVTLTALGTASDPGTYTFTTGSGEVLPGNGNIRVVSRPGTYSVVLANASGCTSSTSTSVSSATAVPLATLSASPSTTLTCAQTALTLTTGQAAGATFAFAGPGVVSQAGNQAIVNASGLYSVTVTNTASGCFSTTAIGVSSATAVVSVTNPAQTLTALGTSFSQNFTASGGGSPYSFSLASGTLPTGLTLSTAGVLLGSATQQGSFPLTVRATDANGCSGTGPTYALSIPTTQFTVLSRDPENGNLNTNTLKPYLLLQNDGGSPIPYGELTVRYWLTVENAVPLRYDVNYAQMGNDKVHFTYVPLSPVRQGATGYIEFSFDPSAGSLAPMSSAVIQDLVNKQDYSMFFQGDDYSYVNNANFAPNPRITAYRNGVPVYGTEPGVVADGGPAALSLTASASPNTIIPSGSTTLSANASGGTSPYSYAFAGPGSIQTSGNTASVSGLSAGMQTFTVTVTDATQPVNQTVTTTVSVTVTAPPVNQPPVATANANQTATVGVQFAYTVGAFSDETPGSLTYTASVNPANGFTFNPATRLIQGTPLNTGVSSVTITATDPGGLSTSTVFTIAVQAQPVVTPLRIGFSASPTTILTTGSSTLSAQVSGGTPGYRYAFGGPGSIQTSGNTATVAALPAGVQTFTVTVTDATSPANQTLTATVSVTVTAPVAGATQLTVLSRDPENGNLNTNTLKPYLLLQNDGGSPIPYGELTVRYWLTVENAVPLRYDVNYAQMGNDKVHFTYVPLSPARQGATGYVEFSFDGSAGSLAPMSNAVIQELINKQDYSMFFQGDDYSYVNNPNFTPNARITAYRSGTLIYGTEPPVGGRMGVENADEVLQVRVLGNPVFGSELAVEVQGAAGQPLRLRVTDLNGHLVSEQRVERAGVVEQQRLGIGQASAGLLFLQVSTPTQSRTVKVLKVN